LISERGFLSPTTIISVLYKNPKIKKFPGVRIDAPGSGQPQYASILLNIKYLDARGNTSCEIVRQEKLLVPQLPDLPGARVMGLDAMRVPPAVSLPKKFLPGG
jgi:hypothetical protein